MSTEYAHPELLVSTGWVAEHINDPKVKIIEVDVDTTSYDKGQFATRSAGTGRRI